MPQEIVLNSFRFDKKLLLSLTNLFSDCEGTCLLYSGGDFDSSCNSYLCLFPFEIITKVGNKASRRHLESGKEVVAINSDPWDGLKELFQKTFEGGTYPEWTGFFSYEMGAYSDSDKQIPYLQSSIPYYYFQRSGIVIAVDHQHEKGTIYIADQAPYFQDTEKAEWVNRLSNPYRFKDLAKELEAQEMDVAIQESLKSITPLHSLGAYTSQVNQVKEWILSGDLYQLNLSQKLTLQGHRNPFYMFYQLAEINPAPFSAFLRLDELAIVCTSPERFLKKHQELLETSPIKGTMPRGNSQDEDEQNLKQLLASEKENAELLMITDLMRNDLGKVSLPGSVVTKQLAKPEAFTNVFHLHSTIESKTKPNLHPVDLIRSCFPGGSITGCPKIRAMERIAEIEKRPRGIYTGSIGYFSGNGDFDFNIAIRTLVQKGDLMDVYVGGAITCDSDPQKEYEETLHKGASLFHVLNTP